MGELGCVASGSELCVHAHVCVSVCECVCYQVWRVSLFVCVSLPLVSWFYISPSNVLLLVTESQHADTSLQPRHLKTVSICHQIDILMCSSPAAKVLIGCLAQWSVKVIHTVNANGLCTYWEATVLHGY